jgi:hypothetical protein
MIEESMGCGYIYQVKVEGKDGDYPMVDACTGGYIRVSLIYLASTSMTKFLTPMR